MSEPDARTLQHYIEELEWRLREHHARLNEAIEQRDQLAIDAAWGVASWLKGATLAAIVAAVAYIFFPHHWLTGLIAIFVAHIAYAIGWMAANRERMKEVDRFAKLPKWDGQSPLDLD